VAILVDPNLKIWLQRGAMLAAAAVSGLGLGAAARPVVAAWAANGSTGAPATERIVQVPAASATPTEGQAAAGAAAGDVTAPASLTIPDLLHRTYTAGPITVDEDLGDQGGCRLRRVHYQSDGLRIYALEALPTASAPASGYPAVVIAHGFENPASYSTVTSSFRDFVVAYARRGMAALVPDYRGHGQSDGRPESAYFASGYAVDVLNLLADLKWQPDINPQALGLVGYSLGGGVALKAAVADSDVKALVELAGATGTPAQVAVAGLPSEQSGLIDHASREKLVASYGPPSDDSPFWAQMAAINYLDGLTAAVAIYHCSNDTVVPTQFSDTLNARLLAGGHRVEYHRCASGGHGFSDLPVDQAIASTADFLAAQLQ